ncbi:serine/threonine-protein kinase [Bradyrhizobium symbiodeficiens]|uniref:Serine/threonine-protein kinase n=1 Tax=Bradyrhizobium symbiodeficiens TaxID=1404367 RepID=A0ABX5WDW7_9BRAD|nr:serine/threonine-protein kinase [Bradyrhizobium symbiodeficiens]QDF41462.1 serine/threonine protein kinase [Bradyrhizobium symbiodeficiens]
MAQVFGGRWKNVGELPGGGQSFVFRVVDTTGAIEGEQILKRLKNLKRIARFRQEVKILQRLDDPHIVKLIDANVGEDEERPYLVMPFASNGDLGRRIELYKGQLDSVVEVALQIARALDHAHKNGVIHRDIKPGNILFPEINHNVWVSDFGISLDQQATERNTPDGEVVGPAIFIAPELTEHGRHDATAAADVYSLGQLIFYMLTGGRWISQQSTVHDPRHNDTFAKGGRYQLLRTLLAKMIAPMATRFTAMADVIKDLESVRDWEKSQSSILFDPAAIMVLEKLQRRVGDEAREKARFEAIRQSELEVIDSVSASVGAMLLQTLQRQADHLKNMGFDVIAVRDSNDRNKVDTGIGSLFEQKDGASLMMKPDPNKGGYSALRLLVCCEVLHSRKPTDERYLGEPGNPRLAVLPMYLEVGNSGYPSESGYIHGRSIRHGVRAPVPLTSAPQWRTKMFGPQYIEDTSAAVRFTGRDWPAAAEDISAMLRDALNELIRHIGQPRQ